MFNTSTEPLGYVSQNSYNTWKETSMIYWYKQQ